MMMTHNPTVFLELESSGSGPLGRLEFELFMDTVPKTAFNFLALCRGSRELYPDDNYAADESPDPSYIGSVFTEIVPGAFAKAGMVKVREVGFNPETDELFRDVLADRSVYGGLFENEDLRRRHLGLGTLAMAGGGGEFAAQNGSQFYICLGPTPWLDGTHTVVGRLVHGVAVLRKMVRESEVPDTIIKVHSSGQVVVL